MDKPDPATDMLAAGLQGNEASDPRAEARRQSLLVRDLESEREVLQLVTEIADLRGWE